MRNTDVRPAHTVAQSGAERFQCRFLGSKTLGQETRRCRMHLERIKLCHRQQALRQGLTAPRKHSFNASDINDVGANPEDHRQQAWSISARMLRTASSSPVNTARAMIA